MAKSDIFTRLTRRLGISKPIRNIDVWQQPFAEPARDELPYFGKAFRSADLATLWPVLGKYRPELDLLPEMLFLNDWVGPGDVAFYYSLIREAKPAQVLEIGSGYSTEVASRAIARNGSGRITCVDPEPRARLTNLGVNHIPSRIEDADTAIFQSLRPGDVLFIDSSHTEAEAMYHRTFLAGLPAGVHVHYHDIDYPWPRPRIDWDEDQAVHDFIRDHHWSVRIFGSALTRDHLPEMRVQIPHYSKIPYRRYNALWLVSSGSGN